MNKIPKVLKLLDLEVDEEFKIEGYSCTFCIDKEGIVHDNSKGDYEFELSDLLCGMYEIVKIPKFPKEDVKYYCVMPYGLLDSWNWLGDADDVALFKLGNFYLNKEEITQQEIDKWVAFYRDPSRIEWEEKK